MKAIEGLFLRRVMRLVKLRHVLSARAHGFLVYLLCPRPTNSCHFNLVFTGVRMSDVYSPPSRVQNGSNCSSMEEYQRKWKQSIDDPAGFWGEIAERFHWKVPPSKEQFLSYNFNVNDGPIKIEWMKGAKLNIPKKGALSEMMSTQAGYTIKRNSLRLDEEEKLETCFLCGKPSVDQVTHR